MTPRKVGLFIALWKRDSDGRPSPLLQMILSIITLF
ncbi:MAG TPA: hypothetical protein DEF78_01870 [Sphingobacterium sp.]|nr:hypothetical protein [Sphingobacterium sp.]